MIAHRGSAAHMFLSATKQEFWRTCVNYSLFFEAAVWAKNAGYSIFDYQGGRQGVFQFKRKFSREGTEFFTAGVIHNSDVYRRLSRASGRVAEEGSGDLFPIYRQ